MPAGSGAEFCYPGPRVVARIREASQEDLPRLAALLGRREGLDGPWPHTHRALWGLEPERIRAWVAVEGERIVALCCAELHRLQVGAQTVDAGYWTNLYVDEEHRDQLLYPRLPQAMLRGLAKSGVSRVYLAIRRLEIAEAHLRIGFRELTRYEVRLKPLRPLSLAAKQLRWPDLAVRLAEPLDRLAGLPLRAPGWRPRRLPRGRSLVRLSLPEDAEGIAELLARARAGAVTRRWDPQALIDRYREAPDGGPYHLLGLVSAGAIIGVAVTGVSTRETDVRVGVILELAARDDDEAVLAVLLRACERDLRAREADGVLLLDSLGPRVSKLARLAGYLDTGERYVLMVAPKKKIDEGDPILDAAAWRFPLADHDAF
jgi:N-acetylglutamate synthase-like GNAT family acetyltransferase